MAFDPKRGQYYRMPIFFGPTPGPRQWPPGFKCDFDQTPRRRVIGARYLSDASALEAMLPACFRLWGEPVVTVEAQFLTELKSRDAGILDSIRTDLEIKPEVDKKLTAFLDGFAKSFG